jgi:hypothetical protein
VDASAFSLLEAGDRIGSRVGYGSKISILRQNLVKGMRTYLLE